MTRTGVGAGVAGPAMHASIECHSETLEFVQLIGLNLYDFKKKSQISET